MKNITHIAQTNETDDSPLESAHPASVAIVTLDNAYNLLWFNNAAAALFELDGSNRIMAADTLTNVFLNGLEQIAENSILAKQQLEQGAVLTGEYKLQNKSGGARFLFATFTPTNYNGEFAGVTAVFQNLNARLPVQPSVNPTGQSAEERLKRHEQQLATIFDTITDVVFLLQVTPGPLYRFMSVNNSFLSATGLTEVQVVGKYVHDVIPEPSLSLVLRNYDIAATNKQTVTWEEKTPYPAGMKTGVVTVTPVCDESGTCTQLVGSVHDITERVAMEQAYKQMYLLVQSSPNYVSINRADAQRTYAFLNKAGRHMLGLDGIDTHEIRVDRLIDADERRRLERIAEPAKGTFSAETSFINQQTGQQIPMMLTMFPIDNEGEIMFASIATDLRDIRQVQKELEKANIQLRQLADHLQQVREEERMDIAREIHDELGQLLTAAKIDLASVHGPLKNNAAITAEKINGALSLIDASIETVREIVSTLRPVLLENLGLIEALRWQLQQFEAKTGIRTQFNSDTEEPDLPERISLALFRICQETLTNVQRYARASLVTLHLTVEHGVLKMLIRDNGVGFDPSGKSTKESFGLLGMKERALMCGGEMQVQSAIGNGTAIQIKIPMDVHE